MPEKLNYIYRSGGVTHMGISVNGALRNVKPNKMDGWMEDEQGRPLSGKYVHAQFKKAQFEGKNVLPMSDNCNAWDYQNGCPGHFEVNVLHDYEWEIGNG